jgi:transcriptional regulator with XRE-family HTH domain
VTAAPEEFSLSGTLRRIRRIADLSQREMAATAGIPKSTLGAAEAGSRDLGAAAVARAAAVAGLRLALLDAEGAEVRPMDDGAVRDMGYRRFPAHLDTRYSEEDWWHGPERYSRPQPWYTFDRSRVRRDHYRRRDGEADDHQLPQPGDSPADRRAARDREIRRQRAEEWESRRAAGLIPPLPPWVCDCPPLCAELEDWEGPPKHADDCRCRCDPC